VPCLWSTARSKSVIVNFMLIYAIVCMENKDQPIHSLKILMSRELVKTSFAGPPMYERR